MIPFTDRFFTGLVCFCDNREAGAWSAGTLVEFEKIGAAEAYEITCLTCGELAFDAVRERVSVVGFSDEEEDAAVGGFGGVAPFDMKLVVVIFLFGVHVAEGVSGDVDDTVFNGEDLVGGFGVFVDDEVPVGEVFSVEKFFYFLGVRGGGRTDQCSDDDC